MSNQRNIEESRHRKIEPAEIIEGVGIWPSAIFTSHVGPQPRMEKKLLETLVFHCNLYILYFIGICDTFFFANCGEKIL